MTQRLLGCPIAAAVIGIYVFLERASFIYQLEGLGITLWSPATGVGVFAFMQIGAKAVPIILAATFITEMIVYAGPDGTLTTIAKSVLQTGTLGLIAICLNFAFRR
jgi:hypothetical protein